MLEHVNDWAVLRELSIPEHLTKYSFSDSRPRINSIEMYDSHLPERFGREFRFLPR
jgi:hypothetical protein